MKRLFLISLPRSGSTLFQAVISNSPAIETSPEPWSQLFISSFSHELGVKSDFRWRRGINALSDVKLSREDGREVDLCTGFREQLLKYEEEQFARKCASSGATWWLDKTPRYYYILEDLWERFPSANFLVLRRNPVSVFRSIYKTWVVNHHPRHLFEFRGDIFDGPRLISEFEEKRGDSPRVKVVDFESVMEAPDSGFGDIFSWLGLDWDEGFLDYTANDKFRGKYGDQTRIHEGKVASRMKFESKQINASEFGDHYGACLARGLAHDLSNGPVSIPRPDLWTGGRRTLQYDCYRDIHRLLSRRSRPSLRGMAGAMLNIPAWCKLARRIGKG